MKRYLLILFFLGGTFNGHSQRGEVIGFIQKQDSALPFNALAILLTRNDSVVKGTNVDPAGLFRFKDIPSGNYLLLIRQFGNKDFVIDSLQLLKDTIFHYTVVYPPPCKYLYVKGQKPHCLGGHTDHIIPIVYGLPTQKTMEKAKKGLIYLGGCLVSGCDPRFYCKIHKVAL